MTLRSCSKLEVPERDCITEQTYAKWIYSGEEKEKIVSSFKL